jgi:hypothetical protein
MSKVIVTLEIEAEEPDADVFDAVNSILDGGLPQDAFAESGLDIQLNCVSAVAHVTSPEKALLDRIVERLRVLDHGGGGAFFKGLAMLELDLIRSELELT